jgi:hypothetical protein
MSRQLIEETRDYGDAMSFALSMSMKALGEHDCWNDVRLCFERWHRMLAEAAIDALRDAEERP